MNTQKRLASRGVFKAIAFLSVLITCMAGWGRSASAARTIIITPNPLTFASTAVGTTSAIQYIVVKNTGTATFTIATETFSASDFAGGGLGTCHKGLSVAAGGTCMISVKFTPKAAGTRTGSIVLTDNATSATQTISLLGTGTSASTVSITPNPLTFASTAVGTTSAIQYITVKNTGTATFTIATETFSASDFAGGGLGSCHAGLSLAAGGTCTISVKFTPKAAGAASGTITLTDNATPATQTISLSGTSGTVVTGPAISITPNPLTFASTSVGVTSVVEYVTLKNTGTAALKLTTATFSSGPFQPAGLGTCTPGVTSLAAGAACTLSVKFTPTAAGTVSGTITLTDNATPTTQTISLSGTGAGTVVTGGGNGTLLFDGTFSPGLSAGSGHGTANYPLVFANPGSLVYVNPDEEQYNITTSSVVNTANHHRADLSSPNIYPSGVAECTTIPFQFPNAVATVPTSSWLQFAESKDVKAGMWGWGMAVNSAYAGHNEFAIAFGKYNNGAPVWTGPFDTGIHTLSLCTNGANNNTGIVYGIWFDGVRQTFNHGPASGKQTLSGFPIITDGSSSWPLDINCYTGGSPLPVEIIHGVPLVATMGSNGLPPEPSGGWKSFH